MMPLMCCQDIRPVECLVTLVTLKRPLACARYLMCFQMTRLGECVFTLIFKGFSPMRALLYIVFSRVLVLLCPVRVTDPVKPLSHWSHLKGFSPVWVLLCFVRSPEFVNALSRWSHLKDFFHIWILLCYFRLLDSRNILFHKSHFGQHKYGRGKKCLI